MTVLQSLENQERFDDKISPSSRDSWFTAMLKHMLELYREHVSHHPPKFGPKIVTLKVEPDLDCDLLDFGCARKLYTTDKIMHMN